VSRIRAETALLDGEIVAVDAAGVPRFQLLQHRSRTATPQIVYYAFDLLNLEGQDLTRLPLEARRASLQRVTQGSGVFLSQFLPGRPEDIVRAARALGLEGIVAKRKHSPYQPGLRTGAWQKLRLNVSQEFVVGGYSPGNPFDGILVGYFEGERFLFAGIVRAGFTAAVRAALFKRLKPLRAEMCPFANLPSRKSGGWNEGVSAEDMAKMTWLRPEVVVQIAFVEWTTYGLLRHASFLGVREDKSALDVRGE
jgi:bifunctional non-homologous end joining protein LigD